MVYKLTVFPKIPDRLCVPQSLILIAYRTSF